MVAKEWAVEYKGLKYGWGRVLLPNALDRNTPTRQGNDAGSGSFRRRTAGRTRRPEKKEGVTWMYPFSIKAFKRAVNKAGFAKRETCSALLHSFATHLIDDGYDIRIAGQSYENAHLSTDQCNDLYYKLLNNELLNAILLYRCG